MDSPTEGEVRAELVQAELTIDMHQAIASLAQDDRWKAFSARLENLRDVTVVALTQATPQPTQDPTHYLHQQGVARGRVNVLDWLLSLPKRTADDINKAVAQVEGLRKKLVEIQNSRDPFLGQ